jgi:hypothetical protein
VNRVQHARGRLPWVGACGKVGRITYVQQQVTCERCLEEMKNGRFEKGKMLDKGHR